MEFQRLREHVLDLRVGREWDEVDSDVMDAFMRTGTGNHVWFQFLDSEQLKNCRKYYTRMARRMGMRLKWHAPSDIYTWEQREGSIGEWRTTSGVLVGAQILSRWPV